MSSHFSALRILLLEDDPLALHALMHHLQSIDVTNIRTATNGLEGLAILKEHCQDIDLIFLDIRMPIIDGIELLRHIEQLPFQGSIIITSCADPLTVDMVLRLSQAHKLSCLGSLPKPITIEALSAKLQSYLALEASPQVEATVPLLQSQEILTTTQSIPYYQVKISAKTGLSVGCEAFLRLQHPSLGLLSPALFLPTLVASQQVQVFTRKLVELSMRDFCLLLRIRPDFTLSMNVSAQDLEWLDLPAFLCQTAKNHDILPQQCTIELTETELVQNIPATLETLAKLRLYGFRLSIDDFGTGFANLAKLHMIAFDELKIDRTFVHKAYSHPTLQAILQSCCALGKNLHMTVVAEGIETQEDKENSIATGVDILQGYYYSPPLALEEFLCFLEKEGPHHYV